MEGRISDRKEKVKVNINSFRPQLFLYWVEIERVVGKIEITYRLPYEKPTVKDRPDWSLAQIKSFGWINDRVNINGPSRFIWWGAVERPVGHFEDGYQPSMAFPLLLEFPDMAGHKGRLCYSVATPPGRPGNPMTILIDRDGEIVPELNFPSGSKINVWPLNRNWEEFGWNLVYPAIGLQFVEGRCERSGFTITRWQAYMMRNRA
jgi:hypothetical protein